jgi:hypothetical protein
MDIKLDHNTPLHLATLFVSLLRADITPDQIMVGIVQLANDTKDLHGIKASVECLRSMLGSLHLDTNAEGLSEFILSLAAQGITTLVLLDALAIACDECGLMDSGIIRITHQRLRTEIYRRTG